MNSPQEYSNAPNIDYMLIHVVYHCFHHSGQRLKQQHAGLNAEPGLRKLIDASIHLPALNTLRYRAASFDRFNP